MSNNNNVNRGTKNELRKDAGNAIRFIEDTFGDPGQRVLLRSQSHTPTSITPELNALLIPDQVTGAQLGDPDAEIVDRALSLIPFAESVHLLSYDAGIVFRARQLGLHARKLRYSRSDGEESGGYPVSAPQPADLAVPPE